MKRIWPILAVLILLLAACGPQEPTESPTEALNQFLTYMKQGKYAGADEYVYAKDGDTPLSDNLQSFDGGNRAFVDKLQAFEFETTDETTANDQTTVTVKSTNINMIPVFADVMSELTALIMSDPRVQQFDDEQMMQFVNDMLAEKTASMQRQDELETVEREFPVTMIRDKGKWKVDMDNEELVMMLTGNIFKSGEAQETNGSDE
ncbi:MAG: hypothetical protein ACOX00_07100 [Peptoniphilaceae bacterium]|jgi:hypothetical protein